MTPAFEQAIGLHRINQLTDVSLGHQERIGKLLLASSLGGTGMIEDIEPADRNLVRAHGFGCPPIDLLVDASQSEPCQDGGIET